MKLERRDGHWLWVGGPVPPDVKAITIGRVVSVRNRAAKSARLLRHEAEHVRQWRTFGVFGFLRRYLGAYAHWRLRGYPHKGAYRRIPLEIEAEWAARRSKVSRDPSPAGRSPRRRVPRPRRPHRRSPPTRV